MFFEGGGVLHFHAIGVLFVLSQTEFCKRKWVIFVSFCSCGKLDCKLFIGSFGDEGGESLNISSFQVPGGKMLMTALLSLLSTLLLSSPSLFEKRNSRRLQGQKPQVLGAFLWGIDCSLFCEEFDTKAALLSSASCLCQNLNAQSNGRMDP